MTNVVKLKAAMIVIHRVNGTYDPESAGRPYLGPELTEALRDSAEALVIVFRRYCLREFGRAPLLADFRDMLAEAARLRSSADSGTEGT